ncbi:hypothetical protein Dimus_011138, partial [Dionaea muscipula]
MMISMFQAEEEAEKEEENQTGFDWEAVIDEAATEGESGSGEKFYDAEDENPSSPEEQEEIPKKNSTTAHLKNRTV